MFSRLLCYKCNKMLQKQIIGLTITIWDRDPNEGGIPVVTLLGDLYKCSECGTAIVSDLREPVYPKEELLFNERLRDSVIDLIGGTNE